MRILQFSLLLVSNFISLCWRLHLLSLTLSCMEKWPMCTWRIYILLLFGKDSAYTCYTWLVYCAVQVLYYLLSILFYLLLQYWGIEISILLVELFISLFSSAKTSSLTPKPHSCEILLEICVKSCQFLMLFKSCIFIIWLNLMASVLIH